MSTTIKMSDVMRALENIAGAPMMTANQCFELAKELNKPDPFETAPSLAAPVVERQAAPKCWSYKLGGEQRFYPTDPRKADFGGYAELMSDVEPLYTSPTATGAWQPLEAVGQIKQGDWLSFTVAGSFFCAQAKLIIDPGTEKEEIVYNRQKNHYFVTSMAVDGTSTHKGVLVARQKKRVTRKGLSVTPKCGFSSFSATTPLQATEYNDRPGV